MTELSAELLESTLRGLRADRVHNRKHPRAPMRVKLTLYPIADRAVGKPKEVWTRDLSSGGIGLLSPEPMRPGSTFIIRLPRNDGGKHLHLLCTVKNCEQQAKGVFAVGASFVEVNHSSAAQSAEDEVKRISQAILA